MYQVIKIRVMSFTNTNITKFVVFNFRGGQKRIEFLVGKIQEIRKISIQLKAEVACIECSWV